MRKLTPLTTSVLLLLSSSLLATTIRVPQDQPTIQAGINGAINGDTVLVAAGTYFENINFNSKNIILKSNSGAEATILTPAVSGTPIISLISGEDTTATIDGFRFLNGNAPRGGGILFDNSNGTVVNCIFDSCKARTWIPQSNGNGGGIACIEALNHVQVSNNIFKNGLGGGGIGQADAIYCERSTVEFSRNLVINNSSAAVIFAIAQSNVKIINNTFASNPGGAIACQASTLVDIRNNIFFNNSIYGVHSDYATTTTIDYNDFINSPLIGYAVLGAGNLAVNPLFFGGAPYDYHLQPISPCIDAGDPSTAVPPGGGPRIDMGAFELNQNLSLFSPRGSITLKRPQLIWTQLRDSNGVVPASFRAIVALDCNFSNADSSPILTDTVWKVPSRLSPNQNYCWKVIAISVAGDSVASNALVFRVVNPSVVTVLPANNAAPKVRRPTFIWQSVSDTSLPESFTYRIILSNDINFNDAETSAVLGDTVWKLDKNLVAGQFGQFYYWKVLALGDSGDTVISAISKFKLTVPLFLFLPDNYGASSFRRPTFIWQSVSDTSIPESFTYRVILSKNEDFHAPETSVVLSDTVWKANERLIVGQTYYWKVLAPGNKGDTVISAPTAFTVTASLSLFLPGNYAAVKFQRPTFIWQAVKDTSIPESFTYRLALSVDIGFMTAETLAALGDTVWKLDKAFAVGQSFFWKIVAVGDSADTVVSNPSKFTLTAPFLLLQPNNFAILNIRRPTFMWQAVNDTSFPQRYTYRLILSKDTTYNFADTSSVLADTTWKVDRTLEANQVYFWKVLALPGNGDTFTGNPNLFSIIPLPFNLYLPSGSNRVRQPTFAWQSVKDTSIPDTYTYRTILSKAADFSAAETSIVLNDTIWKAANKLDLSSTYYWKVESISDQGGSTFSNVRSFKILLPIFNPLLPLKNAIVRERQPTLVWNSVPDTSVQDTFFYGVLVSQNSNFTNAIISPFISDTFWQVSEPLQTGTYYFWKVLAFYSSDGDTIPSASTTFFRIPMLGDLDGDGMFTALDIVLESRCVFLETGNCSLIPADLNCDGQLAPADVVWILNFVILGVPLPC